MFALASVLLPADVLVHVSIRETECLITNTSFAADLLSKFRWSRMRTLLFFVLKSELFAALVHISITETGTCLPPLFTS